MWEELPGNSFQSLEVGDLLTLTTLTTESNYPSLYLVLEIYDGHNIKLYSIDFQEPSWASLPHFFRVLRT
jgi:hypothetical protein